jgi:NAD dependent epimerase/dehydratase
VTGAEGFIGSTLIDLLLDQGADVRAFVHYKPYGDKGFLAHCADDIDIQAGDIRDAGRVSDVVAGCDIVMHLAALIGIPYSYVSPESYVQVNIGGTMNVLQAARQHDVARIVHTSTSETYGTALTVPISEQHPLQPQSPYSASKIGADMMALSYHNAFETPVVVCRPFNTYGPRQSMRAVIPTILQQLHAGRTEIELGAVSPTRDFTFVSDTAAGFIALAMSDAAIGRAVNLGVGEEISIGDLAELCIEVTGSDATVVTDEDRLRPTGSEVNRLRSDNSLAKQLTGWEPEVGLREGLTRTSEWILANPVADLGYAV